MDNPTSQPMQPKLPLEGILVADFSRILAGPLVTQTLAELGATVIKVEQPERGDDTRSWGPPFSEGTATYFSSVNKGKRSIALDLTDEDDKAVALALVAQADVLVQNFRPGVMERLGLGYSEVSERHPELIYCSISGFGMTGPGAEMPGIDLLVQAMAGWMHATGQPDGPPTKVGMAVVDVVAGHQATIGVLAALHERSATGRGRHVSVSLFESALSGLVNLASGHLLAGDDPMRNGNRHPSIAPYEPVRASDGLFILAAVNDRLFATACRVMARLELVDDPRFGTNPDRRTNVEDLITELEGSLRQRPVAQWLEAFTAAGVPVGPVNSISEAFGLAERLGVDIVGAAGDGFRGLRSPIRFDETGRTPVVEPPGLDDHGDLVRRGLASETPLVEWLTDPSAD